MKLIKIKNFCFLVFVSLLVIQFSCREAVRKESKIETESINKKNSNNRVTTGSAIDQYSDEKNITLIRNQILTKSIDDKTKFYFYSLAKKNPELAKSLLLEALSSTESGDFQLMICDVIAILLESDQHEKTLRWIVSNPILLSGDDWNTISTIVAKRDPQLGLEIALELPESKLRKELIIESSRMLVSINPDAIENLVTTISNPDEKNLILYTVANEFLKMHNEGLAISYFKQMPPADIARQHGLAWSFASIIEKHPNEIPLLFGDQILSDQVAILSNSSFTTKLFLSFKSEEIIKLIATVPVTRESMSSHEKYMKMLSDSNPQLVTTWLSTLQTSSYTSKLHEIVYQNIAKNDLQLAHTLISNLTNESIKNSAVKGLLNSISTSNTEQAFKLALNEVADKKTQSNFYKLIARDNALKNPKQAIAILERPDFGQFVDTTFRNEMINYAVQNWAKQDRTAAQQWVEKLPVQDQPKGVQGLVASWMKTDPIAASEWLSKQPAGPARDAGAREVIKQIKDTDPQMAKQWRDSLTPKE